MKTIYNNRQVLYPTEVFEHPSAAEDVRTKELNGYGNAVLLIDAIRHPEKTTDNAENAKFFMLIYFTHTDELDEYNFWLNKIQKHELDAMLRAADIINTGWLRFTQSKIGEGNTLK